MMGFLGGAMGSEKAKRGRARLTNPFLYFSSFLSWTSLRSSMHTRPVTSAVVVTIAGMIFPAIPLDCRESVSKREIYIRERMRG